MLSDIEVREYGYSKALWELCPQGWKDAVGGDVLEFMESILTPDEIAESDLRLSIIRELIKARQEKGISQKKLEELSGVKQPVIARMEKGSTSPQLDTILKVLAPLGKTLAVVPLEGGNR